MQPFEGIDNPVKLRGLVRAMLAMDRDLSLPVLLRHIVEEACSLVDAQYGAFGVLNENHTALSQFITVGLGPDEEIAIGLRPIGLGLLGTLIREPEPLRVRDLKERSDSYGFPPGHPVMGSFLGVPVLVGGEVYGNLYLTNKVTAPEFSEEDEASVAALALGAGMAIEHTRLQSLVRDLTLTEDRDRIARDLHDTVIQRLFAIGLSLQGTARLVERPDVANRITDSVKSIDETIRQLRTAIFELEARLSREGFRSAVLDLMHELTPTLGIHPQVTFTGPVDSEVNSPIADHALVVLREALTNVGKHAGAARVVVTIVAGENLRLVVADDGQGLGRSTANGHGLKNMRTRAERLGGNLELGTSREGGTRLTWTVPLQLHEE